MKIYRIQRISDGLFSTGGAHPRFNKKGKIWRTIPHIKNHLTVIEDSRTSAIAWMPKAKKPEHPYTPKSNFRVVEYVVTEVLSDVTSLDRLL